jgi:hypothetical protein
MENVQSTDHGIAGWLYVQWLLKRIDADPAAFAPALNAILRHNLPEQTVHADQEPLTLLLMLCDHLQEWGRPRVTPYALAQGTLEALRFSERQVFPRKERAATLVIHGLTVQPPQPGSGPPATNSVTLPAPRYTRQKVNFELTYNEPIEGGFEPAISWLLLTRDLQCFKPDSKILPFDVQITMKHPAPRTWLLLPWKPLEMELLQSYADEREPYLCQWIAAARSDQGGKESKGIHYEGRPTTGQEKFVLDLSDLRRPLPRGLDDKIWKGFLNWKWRRLGQKFAAMSLGPWFPELNDPVDHRAQTKQP